MCSGQSPQPFPSTQSSSSAAHVPTVQPPLKKKDNELKASWAIVRCIKTEKEPVVDASPAQIVRDVNFALMSIDAKLRMYVLTSYGPSGVWTACQVEGMVKFLACNSNLFYPVLLEGFKAEYLSRCPQKLRPTSCANKTSHNVSFFVVC